MTRSRAKPKREVLRAAIEAILNEPDEVRAMAFRELRGYAVSRYSIGPGDDEEEIEEVEGAAEKLTAALKNLLELTQTPKPSPKKRGRKTIAEPKLSVADIAILKLAADFHQETGEIAANGSRAATNQGGPFVRYAAKKLDMEPKQIMARIDSLESNPYEKSYWDIARGATSAKKTFAAYLASLDEER